MRDFAEERGLTFTILLDEGSTAAQDYQVRGIPTSFFIDPEGIIQGKYTGGLTESIIQQKVEPLLP